jgi:hypothetical protein
MKPILAAVVVTALVPLAGCASAPPLEPAHGWQLWQEKNCPAKNRQAWQHLEARAFSGVVVSHTASGASPAPPLGQAIVYARTWPRGEAMEQTTGADGRFSFANAAPGLYEVAVCLAGFTPWRGTVRVDPGAKAKELELAVTQ